MNWISICWPMAIAACLTLALIHLQIAFRLRGRACAAHVFFTSSAFGVAVTGSIELALLFTRDLAAYQELMLWAQVSLWLMLVSLTGFVWNFFERGNRWPAIGCVAFITAGMVGNFLVPPELRIRYAVELRVIETFGGVPFTLPVLKSGLLTALEVCSVLSLIVLVVDSGVRTWRNGDRRRVVLVGGSLVLFQLVSRSYALLVETGAVQTPFFFIFPFLGLLLAMGRELSLDVFRAAQLADQLREREHQMELTARAATLGFWVLDLARDSLWATDGARMLFGVPLQERLDFARFLQTLHPDDVELVKRAVAHSVATGEDYEAEYRILVPDGGVRWISARGRVEKDAGGCAVLMRGVVIDITERKNAQAEVDEMRKELAHVTRVSIMGELAASLAHELNQPLAAILSNAQAARRFLASPAPDMKEINEILDDIIRDDKRAGEVIHRLRALVQKREVVEKELLNLNELVRDAERLLHGEFVSRNIELVLKLQPDLPDAATGRVEIQQVLLNLMVNAMDAMRDQPADERVLTVETLVEGDALLVVVRDSGPGIPAHVIPEMFRPFFTTKQHGLGMGLAISRSFVEALGGRLSVRNDPAGGAVFTIALPLSGRPSQLHVGSKSTHH